MKKQIYKTRMIVEILSEEPIPDPISLADVNYEINEGGWSGAYWIEGSTLLEGEAAKKAIEQQGSAVDFFFDPNEEEDDGLEAYILGVGNI